MKNFSIIHILLFIVLMIAYTCSSAQDYVVTTSGDTLTGIVKPMNYGPEKKVQVIDDKKHKTNISLFKTRAYRYKGDIYQPVRNERGYTFMKLIKSGYLSLYAFQPENQTGYDGLYLVKRDGKNMEVPNLSFKKMMTRYLSDCPVVTDKIEDGTLGKKELTIIIDKYNDCIEGNFKQPVAKAETPKPEIQDTPELNILEEKLKSHAEFDGKTDALEMVTEIKNKLQRNEKIPNFLVEGLKSALSTTDLKEELDKALAEIH